jgi:hypothetical protein
VGLKGRVDNRVSVRSLRHGPGVNGKTKRGDFWLIGDDSYDWLR